MLIIGTKQVTQSLYKQLPEKNVINSNPDKLDQFLDRANLALIGFLAPQSLEKYQIGADNPKMVGYSPEEIQWRENVTQNLIIREKQAIEDKSLENYTKFIKKMDREQYKRDLSTLQVPVSWDFQKDSLDALERLGNIFTIKINKQIEKSKDIFGEKDVKLLK